MGKRLVFSTLICLLLAPLLVWAQTPSPPTISPDPTLAVTRLMPTLVTYTPAPITPTGIYARRITLGESTTESFTSQNQQFAYALVIPPGEFFHVILETLTGTGGGCLSVINSEGLQVRAGVSEYIPNGTRTVIPFLNLPDDRTYTIMVRYCNTDGEYRLSVQSASVLPIEVNHIMFGILSDSQRMIGFRFEGNLDDLITAKIETDGFTSAVDFYCGDPQTCAVFQSGYATDYNAPPVPLRLPASGNYVAVVRTRDIFGEFQIGVNRFDPVAITYGYPVQVDFSHSAGALQYTFEANAGDIYSIHADSGGTMDTQLTVISPLGNMLVYDDDSATGFDPEILNQETPFTGKYSIILETNRLAETATVTLRVTRIPPISLDQEPQQMRLTQKQTIGLATFMGMAGETVVLTVRSVTGFSTQFPQISIQQNERSLINAFSNGSRAFTIEFIVPETGQVVVQINGSKGTVELSLERLGQAE